jgi:hypothetical protein
MKTKTDDGKVEKSRKKIENQIYAISTIFKVVNFHYTIYILL